MKILLRVTASVDADHPYEALVTLDAKFAELLLKRRAALQMLKAYDADIWEIYYYGSPCGFLGDSWDASSRSEAHVPESIAEQLGREGESGPENETHEVLPATFVPRYVTARTECDQVVVSSEGVCFMAYPKHCDWEIRTTEIPWETIESAAKAPPDPEERDGFVVGGLAVCGRCLADGERPENQTALPPGEFYLCTRCESTFVGSVPASEEDAGDNHPEADDDHGLGSVLLEAPAKAWELPFTALLQLPPDQDDTVDFVRETWAAIFENHSEVLDWGHERDPEYIGYRLWRASLCVLLKSEASELRDAHAKGLSLSTLGGKVSPRSWLQLLQHEHDWIQSTLVLGAVPEREIPAGYREGQMFIPTVRPGFTIENRTRCVRCLVPQEREHVTPEHGVKAEERYRCVSCGTLFIEPPEGLKEITS